MSPNIKLPIRCTPYYKTGYGTGSSGYSHIGGLNIDMESNKQYLIVFYCNDVTGIRGWDYIDTAYNIFGSIITPEKYNNIIQKLDDILSKYKQYQSKPTPDVLDVYDRLKSTWKKISLLLYRI